MKLFKVGVILLVFGYFGYSFLAPLIATYPLVLGAYFVMGLVIWGLVSE